MRRIKVISDEEPLTYVLLSIVTTFHPLYRDEFIVLNNITGIVEHYKKYLFIKDFWCDRDEPIQESSMIRFRKIRDDYFEEKNMVFLTEKEQFENLIPIEGISLIYSGFPEEETGKKRKLVG